MKIAIDAIRAAKASHYFYSPDKKGRMTVYRTSGNPFGHIILRGGDSGPNFDAASINEACQQLAQFNLPERLVVDFSHANCQNNTVNKWMSRAIFAIKLKLAATKLRASWRKASLWKAISQCTISII